MHTPKVKWRVMRWAVVGLAAAILSAGAAIAAGTPQQKCDKARLLAWGGYVGCMEKAKAALFKQSLKKAWGCRHRYFTKWTAFQGQAALAGSACSGPRFVNNGETVTDNLTQLVWEKKDYPIDPTLHDWNVTYTWSSGSAYEGTGTAFTYFLYNVNATDFDGTKGWRLPTVVELQTILLDFPCLDSRCSCPTGPCIDPVFGPTQSHFYWSSTTENPEVAWLTFFTDAQLSASNKGTAFYVRAVRGGL